MKIKWNKILYPLIAMIAFSIIMWFFSLIGVFIKWIVTVYDWMIAFFTIAITIPLWLFLFLLIPFTTIISRYIKRRKHGDSLAKDKKWTDYNNDSFFNVRWRWRYNRFNNEIAGLFCYCPDDDTELVATYDNLGNGFALCETCGHRYGPFEGAMHSLQERAKRQIRRKLRTGEWKNSINAQKSQTPKKKRKRAV